MVEWTRRSLRLLEHLKEEDQHLMFASLGSLFRMCQCFRNTFFVNPAAGVNCMEKKRLVRACLGFLMSMFCLYSEIWEAASRSTWFQPLSTKRLLSSAAFNLKSDVALQLRRRRKYWPIGMLLISCLEWLLLALRSVFLLSSFLQMLVSNRPSLLLNIVRSKKLISPSLNSKVKVKYLVVELIYG